MIKHSFHRISVLIVVLSAITWACKKETEVLEKPSGFQMQIPEGFPSMPFPEDNAFTQVRWELGKKLFYDPILSVDGSISCASCHKIEHSFADNRDFSPGVKNRPGTRNAPSLANIGYHPYFLREGGVPSLEMQALVPVQEANEFDHSMPAIAKLLQEDPEYVKLFQQAYNRQPDPYAITRALGTFQRSLISGNSAFDKYYYQGQNKALTASQKRGMTLFFSDRAQCSSCHGGFNFTNYAFENNGLSTNYKDIGRMRLTGKSTDKALFKVPSLRNVAVSAPYMHNGQFETLREVVEHYNSGGANHHNQSELIQALNLGEQEIEDLIAFLQSLTDYNFLNNPSLTP